VVDEVGAVMALLEGHADVTMDAAGRGLVPSVRQLRARFEARRDRAADAHGLARLLRRLLGLDAKLAQYRDGAAFVRAVRRSVGIDGLNAVWTDPALLPSPTEISDPARWVRRVHG
jgi:putative hydrolase